MENILDVAQFIFDEYKRISGGEIIDEMKLHKLLYLSQRESIAIIDKPMFNGEFEGWKYGPVSRNVRFNYTHDGMVEECKEISFENAYIVRNVIEEYGSLESWKLSRITHKEISWEKSREGLLPDQMGDVTLKLSDIRIDAEKVRPYDYIWDMYYDEFDDVEEVIL